MKKSVTLVFVLVLVGSWTPQGLSVEDHKMLCNQPPDRGMCLAYMPQYFYNSTSESCEIFIYGGCLGNNNRFVSKRKCMKTCNPCKVDVLTVSQTQPDDLAVVSDQTHSNACNQPPDSGPCFGYMPQFFYNSTSEKCETFIYGGCRGNQNRFDSLTSCQMYCRAVPTFNSTEVCKLLPETGPCRAYIPQFFYNYETKRCEIFIYGGCAGNQNRFDSLKMCLQMCHPDGSDVITPLDSPEPPFKSAETCNLPPEVGHCAAAIPRYFYNSTSEQCEKFIYGGCQGNKNNFASERECLLHCTYEGSDVATFSGAFAKSHDICSLPPKTGPCKASFPRYYYSPVCKSCKPFIYGGCQGNPNNFFDKRHCENSCKET